MLQRLDHPNIIWLEEIIEDPSRNELCIVTEYHSRGSLKDIVESLNKKESGTRCGLREKIAREYFGDILRALFYCHKTIKVIHRDIKPENIVVNCNFEAVLIDFGVCAIIDQQADDVLNQ